MKNLSVKKDGDKIRFTFSVSNRSRTKKINYSLEDVLNIIKKSHDLENFIFLKNESSGIIDNVNTSGVYVFKRKVSNQLPQEPIEKPLDIQKKSVRIEPQIVQSKPLQAKSTLYDPIVIEETKEEIDTFSETLPYGLKSTATKTKAKKKRTTKKKKIEE